MNTLPTPSPAIVSKTFVSFFTAFTLAEVLIVLGIIGLIADMTIPTLHQNVTEKVTAVKLKKVYSSLNSAFTMAVTENGTADNWFNTSAEQGQNSMAMLEKVEPYLNIMKNCGNGAGCFPNVFYKFLNGQNNSNFNNYQPATKIILSDGSLILFSISNPACAINDYCGFFEVDINGDQKPNQKGIDYFSFSIYKNKLLPIGTSQEDFSGSCNLKSSTEYSGGGCSAWVIYNENLDYLHCDDLSWDGKKRCK